ncbi:MAG: rod shape-determining protein RodA [bacterium]|nr:rod shape-determining protein RodA [bacterium]
MNRLLYIFRKTDWLIFSLTFLILALGLLAIYSTSFSAPEQDQSVFTKQITFMLAGFVLMFLVSGIDFRLLRSVSWFLYIGGALLLLLVLVIGTEIRGTTGWIFIGSVGFQPVEFVKLLFIVFLARYFADHGHDFRRVRPVLLSGLGLAAYLGLVLMQPDLGSAIVYFVLWYGLLFLLNIKRRYLVGVFLTVLIFASASWSFALQDYQKERIMTFLNPSQDALKTGYNITQSMVAVGSGEFWGRGLGLGTQSQLNFLPEQQTDFIYAVIAEELGFIGAALLLILFGVLFWRLMKVAREARDDYSLFLASSVIIMIYLQMFINIGMNMGLMPVVGIPLPFVSAGGSSLIASLIAIGMIQSVIIHRPTS